MLDWSHAAWRKLHIGDHPEWIALSWQSRTVLLHLLRAVDCAGRLDMGRAGPKAVAALVRIPNEVFDPGFVELKEAGWIEVDGTWILLPWFESSQNTPTAGIVRTRMWRDRIGDATSQTVTDGDAVRRGVTPCDVERRGEETREEKTPEHEPSASPRALPPVANKRPDPLRGKRPDYLKDPKVLDAAEAWNAMAAASDGRVPAASPADLLAAGWTTIQKILSAKKAHPTLMEWRCCGEMYAAGFEGYRTDVGLGLVSRNGWLAGALSKAKEWEERMRPAMSRNGSVSGPAAAGTLDEERQALERMTTNGVVRGGKP